MVLYFTYTEKPGRTKATMLKIKYAILQALIFKLHFFITGVSYLTIRIIACIMFRSLQL